MKKKVFETERRKHKKQNQSRKAPATRQDAAPENNAPQSAELQPLDQILTIEQDTEPKDANTIQEASGAKAEPSQPDPRGISDFEEKLRRQAPAAMDLGESVRMSDLLAAKGDLPAAKASEESAVQNKELSSLDAEETEPGHASRLKAAPGRRRSAAPNRSRIKTSDRKKREDETDTPAEASIADGRLPESSSQKSRPAKAAPDRRGKTAPGSEKPEEQPTGSPFVRFLKGLVRTVLTWEFLCIVIVLFFAFRLLGSMYSIGLLKLSLGGWIFGIVLAGLFLAGFWFFQTRSKLWKIPAILVCVALLCGIYGGESYVDTIADGLVALTNTPQEYTVQTGVYVPSDVPLASPQALEGQTVGYIPGRNAAFYKSVLDELSRQGVRVKTQSFSTLQQLYKAVRGQSIRAALLTPADLRIISEFSDTKEPTAGLSSAFSVTLGSGLVSQSASIDVTKDAFTVLVSGSRAPLSQEAYSSTLNLLLSVNPSSGQMLVTVIPRALAVAAFCSENFGCREDELQIDRIGLMSYRSQEALRQTVENQFGLPVDFLVRVDLNSISQLYAEVDGLYKSGTHSYSNAAELTQQEEKAISGPKILQLVGTPGSYSGSDFDQELNQLVMLEEIMTTLSKITPMNITKICDVLDNSLATTFDYAQLCALIREYVILPEPMIISYNTIEGVWETRQSEMLTESTYMLNPSVESMEAARENVRRVLNGEEPLTDGTLNGINQSPSATDDLADNPPASADSQNEEAGQPAAESAAQ